MKHIVMFSGGLTSWAAGRRVAAAHGTDNLILLFADTLMEDEDLYRFLGQAAADVGGRLIKIAEGRDPWQVFFDVRFLGNTRVDPCSKILKRKLLRAWLEEHCDPANTIVYMGLDWTEEHRVETVRKRMKPWRVEAPLTRPPYHMKEELGDEARKLGIEPGRLYSLGFVHDNCGGFCIKAGQAQFARLLHVMPLRYLYHEGREQDLRRFLGKDVAILRDRRGGKTKPMTMRAFRERLERDAGAFDKFDWGGCGCFSGSLAESTAP